MSSYERIMRRVEKRATSMYNGFRTAHDSVAMQQLLADETLPLSLKFTAVLAAYAYLPCPCDLGSFRKLIPDEFWEEHFEVTYITFGQGPFAVYVEEERDEMYYKIGMGVSQSAYGLHGVEFVSTKSLLPAGVGLSSGCITPSLDTVVFRYAIYHPFLQFELHDENGIYSFGNG